MIKFMKAQRKKIEVDKWCEGCRLHSDPGHDYVVEWISKNAEWFRQSWEQSCCKSCQSHDECGHHALEECDRYSAEDY